MLPVVIFKESFLIRETQSVICFKSLFYAGLNDTIPLLLSFCVFETIFNSKLNTIIVYR
jgi:hypothetical protein